MNCIVTAGPTFEPLDQVRRLTNHSTGSLGTELANDLADRGHTVRLLLSSGAVYRGEIRASGVDRFGSSAELSEALKGLANDSIDAVFQVAAVGDFRFGKVWARDKVGKLSERKQGKLSTREGQLLVELNPAPKIIGRLRSWFPKAFIAGWKYEVDAKPQEVLTMAAEQIRVNQTNVCVANGPAVGEGFGLVFPDGMVKNLPSKEALFKALAAEAEMYHAPQSRNQASGTTTDRTDLH